MDTSTSRSWAGSLWWKCSAILGMFFGSIAVLGSILELIDGKGPVAIELFCLVAGALVVVAGWEKYKKQNPGSLWE